MNLRRLAAGLRSEAAWIDAAAFAIGLGCAWWLDWTTTDLVWSLWLSSLVVGYAIIVWTVTTPVREIAGSVAGDSPEESRAGRAVVLAIAVVGALFGLAFFTVHFGGFHYVHSAFLAYFFPLNPGLMRGFPGWSLYAEVFRRYWWFLPAAALAERAAFRRPIAPSLADTAVTPEAIAARKRRSANLGAPYLNVVRMHLLIFFFAFARFAHLANFAVYAVAYAAYFFPWRLLASREKSAA